MVRGRQQLPGRRGAVGRNQRCRWRVEKEPLLFLGWGETIETGVAHSVWDRGQMLLDAHGRVVSNRQRLKGAPCRRKFNSGRRLVWVGQPEQQVGDDESRQ